MIKHILQACHDMARILPSAPNGLGYGGPKSFEQKYWNQAVAWLTKNKEHGYGYSYEGIAVNPEDVSDRLCTTGNGGVVSGGGQDWDCYHHPEYTFIVKHSVSAANAFRRIFNMPQFYMIECMMACHIIFYKAILNMVGDAQFNKLFPNLVVSPYIDHMPLQRYVDDYLGHAKAPPNWESNLEIGTRYYICNLDVSPSGSRAGKSGENVIYCGDGKFFGFPFGFKRGDEIIATLNEHRNPGSTVPASFNTSYTRLSRDKILSAFSHMVTQPPATPKAGGADLRP